ncbi:glycosyltransferase family 9 protein [Oleidesulfovibrio sp.]|uniref:glycosyltransferase family 9 protein n=1 Tax=Oleidesulfovibrio sp. TaxID=2909707 RepID=UPI003A88F12E
MNTLLINLTRFGDLLQTQPVISGLAAQGHRVSMVCLENFAPATTMLRHVDAVYPLPGARLLSQLDHNWYNGLGELWQWSQEVRNTVAPTSVINLTASLSVRLLSRHITPPAATLNGFALDEDGFGYNTDSWTTFLQASTRMRGCSPFNLIDLFRMSTGLGNVDCPYDLQQPDAAIRTAMDNVLRAQVEALQAQGKMTEAPASFVTLQLGASENRRRWPVEHFASLGDLLWQTHRLCPVLLGAKGEAELGERYAQRTTAPHINLIGRTDIPSLGAALLASRLLVSNDTGTMHLAAGLNVPVLAIFLATAQPWDTGPYKEGMCSLEPDMPCHPCAFNKPCAQENACRWRIRPRTIHAMVSRWLENGAWSSLPEETDARVWVSRKGENGFMNLESLSGHAASDRTAWVRMQRHFYSQFLDRPAAAHFTATDVRSVNMPQLQYKMSKDTRNKALAELEQTDALLHLLQEQGNALRHRSVDVLKKRFLSTWQRVQTLWDASPEFNVLGFLWLSETQEAGSNLDTTLALASQYRALTSAWHQYLAEQE